MIEFISPIQTYYATTLLAQHEAEDSPIRRETLTLYFHARTPSMAEIETLVREHYSKKEDVFREILSISKHTTPPGQSGTLGVEDGVTEGFTHTFVVQTVAVDTVKAIDDCNMKFNLTMTMLGPNEFILMYEDQLEAIRQWNLEKNSRRVTGMMGMSAQGPALLIK